MTEHGRTIDVRGHVYTLVAAPTRGDAGWTARVGRYEATGGAAAVQGVILDARSNAHDMAAVAGTTATGPTAEAALERLAEGLRGAIEGATLDDAEELDRRARDRTGRAGRDAADADD